MLYRRGLRPLLFCKVTSIKEIVEEEWEAGGSLRFAWNLGKFLLLFLTFIQDSLSSLLVSCGLAGKSTTHVPVFSRVKNEQITCMKCTFSFIKINFQNISELLHAVETD